MGTDYPKGRRLRGLILRLNTGLTCPPLAYAAGDFL